MGHDVFGNIGRRVITALTRTNKSWLVSQSAEAHDKPLLGLCLFSVSNLLAQGDLHWRSLTPPCILSGEVRGHRSMGRTFPQKMDTSASGSTLLSYEPAVLLAAGSLKDAHAF